MRKYFLFISTFGTCLINAQLVREITYGVSAGAIYSQMNNLEPMIIPQGVYQNYSTSENAKFGAAGGVFLNWKYPTEKISVQLELYYSRQSTDFKYNDKNGLNYNIKFPFHNLNLGFLLKYYFTDGFYIGAGPFFTFSLDKDALTYTSNAEELSRQSGVYFEPDAVVQKTLKESFEGKDYFHSAFAIGYEFYNGLNIGFRYHLGLSDALETQENGHRFKNTNNKVSAFSLQIGYSFSFDGHNNF